MSPANVPGGSQTLNPSDALKVRKRAGAGSVGGAGSDTDAMASDRDGGAMSDASRARTKIKLRTGASPPATGPSSRAGSPVPGAGRGANAPSPGAGSPPATVAFPSVQDIKNAIPPQGIPIKDLMKVVAHPRERRQDFVTLVRSIARMDKERQVLMLK